MPVSLLNKKFAIWQRKYLYSINCPKSKMTYLQLCIKIAFVLVFCVGLCSSESEPRSELKYGSRSTEHIRNILHNDDFLNDEASTIATLKRLVSIYRDSIEPLENAYRFSDISPHLFGEGELFAVPRISFVGPWSTGKSSLINYLLDIENSTLALVSGAQPTTSDFTVLTFDDNHKVVGGSVLAMQSSYSSLEKFGHSFLERLENIQIPRNILKKINFVDTPGIIENRKQHERGYPFAGVCQWFIDRSDLIVLVFDPTKLDVGSELEVLFKQMKEREAKVRIILNKADSLTSEELLRVYGTLYWSLAPLINTTEPPKVFIGSFWSKQYQMSLSEFNRLFKQEETLLAEDIADVICQRVENKIAFLRKHAIMVRNHAMVVDEYLKALQQHRSIFRDINDIALSIIYAPEEYNIFQKVLAHPEVSKVDLFTDLMYRDFFTVNSMDNFIPLSKQCGLITPCLLESINYAIHHTLPLVLEQFERLEQRQCAKRKTYSNKEIHEKESHCNAQNEDCSL